MPLFNRILTVDPGWFTGVAFWQASNPLPLVKLLEADKNKPAKEKIRLLASQFDMILEKWSPRIVWIEDVAVWTNSAASVASAARGDLIELARLTQSYVTRCDKYGIESNFIRPIDWKGNMNKKIVEARVKLRLGINLKEMFGSKAEHIYDAVGIGLGIQGVL